MMDREEIQQKLNVLEKKFKNSESFSREIKIMKEHAKTDKGVILYGLTKMISTIKYMDGI